MARKKSKPNALWSTLDKGIRSQVTSLATLISNPYTFLFVLLICAGWIGYGSLRGFPEDWTKITDTSLAFGTFLIVFIIQFSGESDTYAQQKKLDAIIESDTFIDQSVIGHEHELKGTN